jgi:hypothetical protein
MGEIADMMIEGHMCETCGEVFDEAVGYPRQCKECRFQSRARTKVPEKRISCDVCGKLIAPSGMRQHFDAKHKQDVSDLPF